MTTVKAGRFWTYGLDQVYTLSLKKPRDNHFLHSSTLNYILLPYACSHGAADVTSPVQLIPSQATQNELVS